MYFTIKKDRDGWRAGLWSGGNLVWWTEGYVNKSGAENAVRVAQATGSNTPVHYR